MELPHNTVSSSPAVANGVVYFGSDDDKLYALNATRELTCGAILLEIHLFLTDSGQWRGVLRLL